MPDPVRALCVLSLEDEEDSEDVEDVEELLAA